MLPYLDGFFRNSVQIRVIIHSVIRLESLRPITSIMLIYIKVVNPDSVHNFYTYLNRGVNKDMSTLEKTDDSETVKKMSINVAVIFGVITALIIVSIYLAENLG